MIAHPFTDPVSGQEVTLYVGFRGGVKHGGCPHWADVIPELDCFYCSVCGWNGRISGAWFLDVTRQCQDQGGAP